MYGLEITNQVTINPSSNYIKSSKSFELITSDALKVLGFIRTQHYKGFYRYRSRATLKKLFKNIIFRKIYRNLKGIDFHEVLSSVTSDKSGRVLALMPHPERGIFFTQQDNWPLEKEKCKRSGVAMPKYGDGMLIFENALKYFA